MQQDKDMGLDGKSKNIQAASTKHKNVKSKDHEAEQDQRIPDDKYHQRKINVDKDVEEAELELDSIKDEKKKKKKKKKKKDGDDDEEWRAEHHIDKKVIHVKEDEAQKGEKSKKRKQGDDVGVDKTKDAEGKRRKKGEVSAAVAAGKVADAGLRNNNVFGSSKHRFENMKEGKKKKDKDPKKPEYLVLEASIEECSKRTVGANNEGSTGNEEKNSGDKKKTEKKKALDNCDFKKDNLKAEEDTTSEMPSSTTATEKKRKKSKEKKYKNGDNQTAKGSSKNEVNVEVKMTEKIVQAAEAEGSRDPEKGTDDSEVCSSKKKRKKKKSTKDGSVTSALKKKKKKVSFSSEVEVFPAGNDIGNEEDTENLLVQGKRFTPEEDNKIKKAIDGYIQTHQLGEEGKQMVLNCRRYPEVKNCWKEIGACMPYRPYTAIYYRAHSLLERSENRKWEPEEYDMLRRFYATHGAAWKTIATQLGKNRVHVKDAWRRIKLPNLKNGAWSQDEYQTLFDLVNMDLRMKAFEEKKTKHGMLRDNIHWDAISDKLTTRINAACCVKWYDQLTSPLVNQGLWADADDYRLLDALQDVDACCPEDVEWDNLLEHRSGEICRKRWNEMTRHIGGYKEKPFIEQVEVLSKRYCPEMIEYRE